MCVNREEEIPTLLRIGSVVTLAAVVYAQVPSTVLHLAEGIDGRGMAEIGSVVESLTDADMRVNATDRTLTVEGAPWQVELAKWLVPKLERLTGGTPERYEIRGEVDGPLVRILYTEQQSSSQALQQLAGAVREILGMQHVAVCLPSHSLAMRGTAEELPHAEWLVGQLDRRGGSATRVVNAKADDGTVRVIRLNPSVTAEQMEQAAAPVRLQSHVRLLVLHYEARAVVVRGATEDIGEAERLLRQLGLFAGSR